MGIATEMEKLVADIISSYRDRNQAITDIKKGAKGQKEGTKDLIKGFRASREEMKAELKEASAAWQGLTAAKAKNTRNKGGMTKKWESQQE